MKIKEYGYRFEFKNNHNSIIEHKTLYLNSLDDLPDVCIRGCLGSKLYYNDEWIVVVDSHISDPTYRNKYVIVFRLGLPTLMVKDYYKFTLKQALDLPYLKCRWCNEN